VVQTELKARLPGDDLRGEVTVADSVIAKLAGRTALATYGVVDLRRSRLAPLVRLFRDELMNGVEVDAHESYADIVLHVVIERGLNLAEVTRTLVVRFGKTPENARYREAAMREFFNAVK